MLAAHPIRTEISQPGSVILGIRLDNDFARSIRDQTGLEHSVLIDQKILAVSHNAAPTSHEILDAAPSNGLNPEIENYYTFKLDNEPYYAARFKIEGSDLLGEVALPVGDIVDSQGQMFWTIIASIASVTLLGSILGVLFARSLGRPLIKLAEGAARLSKGDLDTPLNIETRIVEVAQVAKALENARADLLQNLTQLKQEKAWVNHLLESIVEGIITLDSRMHITFFSHGAERITGWSRDQVLHRQCNAVFQTLHSDLPFTHNIPPPGSKSKVIVRLASGNEATLSISRARLAPLEVSDAQVALVFRDVSDEELIHRLMGHFLSNIAHEFRTPLSAIAASIELLVDQSPELAPEELEELLQSLHLGVISLQTLVDNLLESASIEAGHFHVSPRPYNLGEIIQEAAGIMQPLLDKYDQHLTLQVPPDLPLVMADPRRIVQVLVNLLSNASKYGPSDAEISISAQEQDGWVRVCVADRGPGISQFQRDYLFKRFEYDKGIDHAKAGAGLGLSVVKAIVEAHGGAADADDRPGGGAIFWFNIPAASSDR